MGGSPPIGAQKAKLDELTQHIIAEFGYQEVGHLRDIKTTDGGFLRPLMNLSASSFAELFDKAFGHPLSPPFDPYINSLDYILASYVGLVAYVGANPNINGYQSKRVSTSSLNSHQCVL